MKSWQPGEDNSVGVEKLKAGVSSGAPQADRIPAEIVDWLARLSLLYGVPFDYLVPDAAMLPVESIRFFHIDQNWIDSIVDGACSIGRNTSGDRAADGASGGTVRSVSAGMAGNVRRRLLGKTPKENTGQSTIHSGFILRSAIVHGWPGLEVNAFEKTGSTASQTPLPMLRMDRLSNDVMICIFQGSFQVVEILEPPEALHFGTDVSSAGKRTKMLCGLGAGNIAAGRPMDNVPEVNVPMRAGGSRVVDVAGLAQALENGLKAQNELGQHFTSAEFALEMVESAQKGVFTNNE